MTTISKNLRKIREKKTNYSQSDMAELLGIRQSTYCNWESGLNDIKSEYIPKIATLLGVEIKDLFSLNFLKNEATQNNTNNEDDLVNELILDSNDENSIKKIVEFLNKKISKQ